MLLPRSLYRRLLIFLFIKFILSGQQYIAHIYICTTTISITNSFVVIKLQSFFICFACHVLYMLKYSCSSLVTHAYSCCSIIRKTQVISRNTTHISIAITTKQLQLTLKVHTKEMTLDIFYRCCIVYSFYLISVIKWLKNILSCVNQNTWNPF